MEVSSYYFYELMLLCHWLTKGFLTREEFLRLEKTLYDSIRTQNL